MSKIDLGVTALMLVEEEIAALDAQFLNVCVTFNNAIDFLFWSNLPMPYPSFLSSNSDKQTIRVVGGSEENSARPAEFQFHFISFISYIHRSVSPGLIRILRETSHHRRSLRPSGNSHLGSASRPAPSTLSEEGSL